MCPFCVDYENDSWCPRCHNPESEMHTMDLEPVQMANVCENDSAELITPGGPDEEFREEPPVMV
jgi:hypothetical protein